jgi:hypothetical protein
MIHSQLLFGMYYMAKGTNLEVTVIKLQPFRGP